MVFIIDGNHLAARCFYAVDLLTTSANKPTNVIFGFLGSLRSFVKRYALKNNYFFVTWDSPGEKERHKLFPNYKLNRKRFPDEFYEQMNDLKKIITSLPIQQFEVEGVEADDLIGTITSRARKIGQKVLILSSDHDFEQLINKNVQVLVPSLAIHKQQLKDVEYVLQRYDGIQPQQIVELMAITGDATDGIDGVPGIGEKIAINLLKANSNLEGIIKDPDNLKYLDKEKNIKDASPKIKEKIKTYLNRINLNSKLVKINCSMDINVEFKHRNFSLEELKKCFEIYEFKRYLNEIDSWQKVFTE